VLRGSGVGEPLGILNSDALVNVTPATNNVFTWVDALEMLSKHKVLNGGKVAWSIHNSMLPDIGQFETTGGGGVLQQNLQSQLGMIAGKPIVMSEHQPQANNSGCVILGDWSAYMLFMRQELVIDFSEHVGFLTGMDTWRFYQRNDGMPWLKDTITLADPQGSYEVSPFVSFND
jgi:HK97 family phage major capsid protein